MLICYIVGMDKYTPIGRYYSAMQLRRSSQYQVVRKLWFVVVLATEKIVIRLI